MHIMCDYGAYVLLTIVITDSSEYLNENLWVGTTLHAEEGEAFGDRLVVSDLI